MDRRKFLESLGIGAAFAVTASCLQSCKKDVLSLDFTLNLDDAANVALKTNGGYVISNGVVVARDKTGNIVAVTQTCSHQNQVQVTFNGSANEFNCSAHGARFDTNGAGLNANGSGGLQKFKTTLTGSSLRVFS